jgi:fermentation-respiration switch protein FrsA (DUF1100 family)
VALLFLREGDFQTTCRDRKGRLTKAEVKEREPGERGLEKQYLTLKSTSGLEVDLGVLSPPREGGRRPGVILLAGNAAGAHAIDEALETDDVVMTALGYRYTPPEDPGLFDSIRDVPRVRRALFDVVPGVLLAADYLRARNDVDPKRIALVGLSFGALYVPAVVEVDRGFAAAVMVDGGGDLRSLLVHNVERAGYPGWAPLAGVVGSRLLSPLEPLRHAASVSPVPLVMINATEDELVPRPNVLAFYEAAREPKSLIWLDAGHVHLGDRALLRRVVEEVRKALLDLKILERVRPEAPVEARSPSSRP